MLKIEKLNTIEADEGLSDIGSHRTVVERISRDIKHESREMNRQAARFMVDNYYSVQKQRIRLGNQLQASMDNDEESSAIRYVFEQFHILERQVQLTLDHYSKSHPVGQWIRTIPGIGPVIAAGLLAHLDVEDRPTAGHFWNYAGLNPDQKWEKGQKRPWNSQLKTLCWKLGESFVKVSNNPKDVYGKIYKQRKEYELAKNEAGDYSDQAEVGAARVGKTTEAYKSYSAGKLPDGHIHARAKRYAVKLFLSHLHEVMYRNHYKEAPPKPYAIEHLGHAHYIPVPYMD